MFLSGWFAFVLLFLYSTRQLTQHVPTNCTQILPDGKSAKIKFKKFKYCPTVLIADLRFAENISTVIAGCRCDYKYGDQVEVFFQGKWLPAQVEKIVREGLEYGVTYIDRRDKKWYDKELDKKMLSVKQKKSVHRFTPDKMRTR